ncbi:MAG: cyclic nucleotide-binding domain-containing protein [Pseudanabaenaceae cyanobacterium SKYGB_i_bin29]|nr:cyclic nucleotide-binding domain-containing protein [Pseudanabaenaceae cyanobacterium SKYG29]MDW8421686.1 cyclic nucleotide-binding domain-containing protein [Pseudanabaenaceae cyanobacterium SKYGB_i_bin29]
MRLSQAKRSLWEIVQQISFFQDLPPSCLEVIVEQGFPMTLPPYEYVFWEQEWGDCFFVILQGQVEMISLAKGCLIRVLQQGDFFGEIAVLLNTPRSLSVRTIAPTRLFAIEQSVLNQLFMQSPQLAAKVTEALCARWNELIDLGIFSEADRYLSPKEAMQLIYRRIRLVFNNLPPLQQLSS